MDGVACPSCGSPSPIGSKFCPECGTPLPLLCPGCGAAVAAGQKFCAQCGMPLTGTDPSRVSVPRPLPPEERRLVTALFCDLVGFTPLAESLDPEEIRVIQARYFSAMSAQIERYGGTVEKYAGDAVLALFGVPVAHEDDPERAVLCALGMQGAIRDLADTVQEGHGTVLAIRVGVNTGEVVSGIWDAAGQQQVAVTGDAVNTAARLQAAAGPGEVLVGAETMRLTRRRIDYGDRRTLSLKGKAEPIGGFAAIGLRKQASERWEGSQEAGASERRSTPLIGRRRELETVLSAWRRAASGEGQLLTVIGEPGVGKSRLLAEGLERIASEADVRILRGRCLSYGQTISLWLVADLVRSICSITQDAGIESLKEHITASVERLLTDCDATDRAIAQDVLGEVLGLPAAGSIVSQADPQTRRGSLIRTLRLLLGGFAQREPLVLVLEDLHWLDAASREVLDTLLLEVPGLRLLALTTQRPGWSAPWNAWSWSERLTLRPLDDQEAALLAAAVLGGTRLSPRLVEYLLSRAKGIPFFVEELLHYLQETGSAVEREGELTLASEVTDRLPATLSEILLARLDRLERQVKEIAQVGSVIGRSFAVRLLSRVTERGEAALAAPLRALQEAEIAFPRESPEREYLFKHATLRDAAYSMLVLRRRRELHLATARAIAQLYPSDEYVEMIAYHYAQCQAPEAAEWLERAGDRAAAIYSIDAAVSHYSSALQRLEAASAPSSDLARMNAKLGSVLLISGQYDRALEQLGLAAQRFDAANDLEAMGSAVAQLGMAHRLRGSWEDGLAVVRPAIQRLEPRGPSSALLSLHLAESSLAAFPGRQAEHLEAALRAATLARLIGDPRLLGEVEAQLGLAFCRSGRTDEGLTTLEHAIPLIEAGGDILVLYRALNNLAVVYWRLGLMEDNRRTAQRAIEAVQRVGNRELVSFALGNLGDTLITLGEWQEAKLVLDRALELVRAVPRTSSIGTPLQYQGRLALCEGRWEDAERWLAEALAVVSSDQNRQLMDDVRANLAELDLARGRPANAASRLEAFQPEADAEPYHRRVLSRAYIDLGKITEAAAAIEPALRQVRDEGLKAYLPELLLVDGMVRIRQERWEDAQAALLEGLEIARSLPSPYAEARILVQLSCLSHARTDLPAARDRLAAAVAIFRRLGATKDLAQAEVALHELAAISGSS